MVIQGTTQETADKILDSKLNQTNNKFGNELEELRNTVKLKESEIGKLNKKLKIWRQ